MFACTPDYHQPAHGRIPNYAGWPKGNGTVPPATYAHHSREQRADATDMATIRHAHLFPISYHRHKTGLAHTIDIGSYLGRGAWAQAQGLGTNS